MKNLFKKALALICVICIIAVSTPYTYASNGNDNHLLYGRKQLQKSSESNYMTKAYDRIVEGIENRESQIVLEDLSLTVDELLLVVELYRNDSHAHFWLDLGYTYSAYTDGTVFAYKPKYNSLGSVSDKEFEAEKNSFNKEVDSIIKKAGIRSGMSQYDIELRLHNALIQELDYVIDAPNAHNAYGAIIEKQAVCQGYTLAFNYLLRVCGIEAHYVAGYSRDIPHAWSLVSIDGAYYYTDITWDDPVGALEACHETYHTYFNLTEDDIKADHTFNSTKYELPSCNTKGGTYFEHNPNRIISTETDVKTIASFFDHGSASIYVPTELNGYFMEWYKNNIRELATLAGYDMSKPISYIYSFVGNEYHLILDGTLLEPEITVLRGDVDGDGNVTSMDANLLKRIISGSAQPTEINILGGDLDGDGSLTSMDSNLLKRLIAGK